MKTMTFVDRNTSPPSWEVLVLVSHYLDPKTLSISSCVSKSWCACFSSDNLWYPLCSSQFPSLSSISFISLTVPYHRLFALGHEERQRRLQKPCKPRLTLDRLTFCISISTPAGRHLNIIKPCNELTLDPHGLFKFDIEVNEGADREWSLEELDGVRMTWVVVDKEWKALFTIADESGRKGSFASGVDGWFGKELPPTGCCSWRASSGLVADFKLGLVEVDGDQNRDLYWLLTRGRGTSKVRIEKVSVGVLSILNWHHVNVDDTLCYLEQFLLV